MIKEILIFALLLKFTFGLDICHLYENECHNIFQQSSKYKIICSKTKCHGENR